MKLIVGLGNPGQSYARNRHNIGFICVSHFARKHGIKLDKKQGLARIGTGEVDGIKMIAARPQTGMNISGESVGRLVKKFKINHDNLLIIYDDMDLPTGKIRFRYGSSSGGHKGINSIINHLGSHDFTRLAIGIGRPNTEGMPVKEKGAAVIGYVLSDFTREETGITIHLIPIISEAILYFFTEGLTAAMNKYNNLLPESGAR